MFGICFKVRQEKKNDGGGEQMKLERQNVNNI